MFTAILHDAPAWVWPLLAALIALGVSQAFARTVTLRRAILVPVAMVMLSLNGVVATFGAQGGTEGGAIAAWALGLGSTSAFALAAGLWRGMSWLAAEQRLRVPGSWWPMALILGVFVTKFAVGTALAMQPMLAHDGVFAIVIGAVYGAFSGMFLSRGLAMWRVAHASLTQVAQPSA